MPTTLARGTCRLFIKVEDSEGIARSTWQHFVIVDNPKFSILLGDPWLVKADPVIAHRGHRFYHPQRIKLRVAIISSKKQILKAFRESRLALIILAPHFSAPPKDPPPKPQEANISLPYGLEDYRDVASIQAAAIPL